MHSTCGAVAVREGNPPVRRRAWEVLPVGGRSDCRRRQYERPAAGARSSEAETAAGNERVSSCAEKDGE